MSDDWASPGYAPFGLGNVWVGEVRHPLLDQRKPFSANPSDWYHAMSDSDVERIAKRVVELLREAKP